MPDRQIQHNDKVKEHDMKILQSQTTKDPLIGWWSVVNCCPTFYINMQINNKQGDPTLTMLSQPKIKFPGSWLSCRSKVALHVVIEKLYLEFVRFVLENKSRIFGPILKVRILSVFQTFMDVSIDANSQWLFM